MSMTETTISDAMRIRAFMILALYEDICTGYPKTSTRHYRTVATESSKAK
jgi:hypothetical protein